ncbi:MAG: hypothetical protein Q4E61_00705 [Alphaproteobacteria bacterium]|nr:hypothetical protein [Alphaproteobacteria bacterium]
MKLFKIIILIFCFIYSSKSQESDQWSIIRYISDDYPGISYFELNNGSIGYIYIDTLQKREEQKERLKLLQNSKVYPFIQKNPRILFYDLCNPDFSIEYEERISSELPEYLACYMTQKEIFKKDLSEIKNFLNDSDELFQDLLKVQKEFTFIDLAYCKYERLLYDLAEKKAIIDSIKSRFPIIFNSFKRHGVTGLIRDYETGYFSEEGFRFFKAIQKGFGEQSMNKIFKDFRKDILQASKLHKDVLATNISYDDMKILMKTQFEMDEISLYYITH